MLKLSEGHWCAYECARCGITYKRPQPHRMQRSNLGSQDCDSCGLPAKITWGRVVSAGKDVYFVADEAPANGAG